MLYVCYHNTQVFFTWSVRVTLKNLVLSQVQNPQGMSLEEASRITCISSLQGVYCIGPTTSIPQWVREKNPNINTHPDLCFADAVWADSLSWSWPRRDEKKKTSWPNSVEELISGEHPPAHPTRLVWLSLMPSWPIPVSFSGSPSIRK